MTNDNQNMPNFDAVFKELGLNNLSPEEKQEVQTEMMKHFNDIILQTVVDNLSDSQIAEFQEALQETDAALMQEKIADITSRVPGLNSKIELAVQQELAHLKSAYQQVA
jgi:hypothetical protein